MGTGLILYIAQNARISEGVNTWQWEPGIFGPVLPEVLPGADMRELKETRHTSGNIREVIK